VEKVQNSQPRTLLKTIRDSQQMRMIQSTVLTSDSMKRLEEYQELKRTYKTYYSGCIIYCLLEFAKK